MNAKSCGSSRREPGIQCIGIRGFTLVEVVAALGILAMAITLFSQFFVDGISGLYVVHSKRQALYAAQSSVESALGDPDSIVGDTMTLIIPFEGYNVMVEGKKIDVSSEYKDRSRTREVHLSTFLPD